MAEGWRKKCADQEATIAEQAKKIENLQALWQCAHNERSEAMLQVLELTAQRDAAMKDAERYRWLKSQKGLELSSFGGSWIKDGTKFDASHRLCANDTVYKPY